MFLAKKIVELIWNISDFLLTFWVAKSQFAIVNYLKESGPFGYY
jgi:hypothetical protein